MRNNGAMLGSEVGLEILQRRFTGTQAAGSAAMHVCALACEAQVLFVGPVSVLLLAMPRRDLAG